MKTFRVEVSNESASIIEQLAQERGVTPEVFLGFDQDLVRFIKQLSRRWMMRPKWDELLRGDGCPICQHLLTSSDESAEGYKVRDMGITRLHLMRNQFVNGYCVLTCVEHVREPYQLDVDRQRMFFEDLMRAGRAIDRVFKPDKMNFEILGNSTPHLHCHIKPRFYDDFAPGIPIDQNARTLLLQSQEYRERVEQIRSAIDTVSHQN